MDAFLVSYGVVIIAHSLLIRIGYLFQPISGIINIACSPMLVLHRLPVSVGIIAIGNHCTISINNLLKQIIVVVLKRVRRTVRVPYGGYIPYGIISVSNCIAQRVNNVAQAV